MNTTQNLKRFLITIQEDRKRYISLHKLLMEQNYNIIKCNADKLLDTNQRVTEIYLALSHTATERLSLLKQLEVAPCREEINTLFSRLPEKYREHITALWADLGQRIKLCKKQNQRNGTLVAMQHDIFSPLLGYQEEYLYTE